MLRARGSTELRAMCLPRLSRPLAAVAVSAALLSLPPTARAEDEAKARLLFQQGRVLLGAGKIDEACDAFQESTDEYGGSSGSWLNLALCREKQGKIASAWRAYRRAAEVSEQSGDDRKAAAARQLAVGLEPKLSKITISVPQRVLGQLVQLDGSALTNAEWGSALPVDPGEHAISVSAPRYEDWSTTVQVEGPRGQATVLVPKLVPLPGMAPAPGDDGASPDGTPTDGAEGDAAQGDGGADSGGSLTTAGIGLFVGAGVAVVVGAALGITALALQSDYEEEPTEDKADTGDRVTVSADVAFIVGIAAAAAGLVLVLVDDGDGAERPEGDDASTESAWRLELAPVGPTGEPGLTASWTF